MSLARADLPTDPAALRAFALACQDELKAAELAVQYKTLEIEKLKFQIAADAIRPLVGTDQPPDRSARTAARGAGVWGGGRRRQGRSRQSRGTGPRAQQADAQAAARSFAASGGGPSAHRRRRLHLSGMRARHEQAW